MKTSIFKKTLVVAVLAIIALLGICSLSVIKRPLLSGDVARLNKSDNPACVHDYGSAGCTVDLATTVCSVCKASVWDGTTSDTSWFNADENEFTLTNATQLAGFSVLAADGNKFETKTILIGTDIDLNKKEWTPISDCYGVFDGNGKTVRKLLITSKQDDVGFFSTNSNKIVNLFFDSCEVRGKNNSGIVAGNGATIEKVSVTNSTVTGDYLVGGITGFAYGDVKNCIVNNVTITAVSVEDQEALRYPSAGGIAGMALGGVAITNCSVSGSQITTGSGDAKSYSAYSSGILAESGSGTSYGATRVFNCKVNTTILQAINARSPKCGVFNAAVSSFSSDGVPTMIGYNSTDAEETETVKYYADDQEGAYSQIFLGNITLDGTDYFNSATTDKDNKKTSFALPEDVANIKIGLPDGTVITELKVAGQVLSSAQYSFDNDELAFTVQNGYMQIELTYTVGAQAYSLVLVKAAEGVYPELTYLVKAEGEENFVPITTYKNTIYSDKSATLIKGTGYAYKIRVGELASGVTLTVNDTVISSAGDYDINSTDVSYFVTKDGLNTDARTFTILEGLVAYPNVENLYYTLDTDPCWVYGNGQFESNFSATAEPPTYERNIISFYCIGRGTFGIGYEFKGYALEIIQDGKTLVEKYGQKDESTNKFNQINETLKAPVSTGYSTISVTYYDYDAANEKAYLRDIEFVPPLEIKFEYDGDKAEIRNVSNSAQVFNSGDVYPIDEIKGLNFYTNTFTGKMSIFDDKLEASYIVVGFTFNGEKIEGSDEMLYGYEFTKPGTLSLIIEERIPVKSEYSLRAIDENGNVEIYTGTAEMFSKTKSWNIQYYDTEKTGSYAVIPYGKTYSKLEFLIPAYGKNEKCFVIPKKYDGDDVLCDDSETELTVKDGYFVYTLENVSFDTTRSFFDFYYTAAGSIQSYYGVAGYRIIDSSKTINDIIIKGKEYVEIINDSKYPYVLSSKAMKEDNVVAIKSTNHDYDSSSRITFRVNQAGALYIDTLVEGNGWSDVSIAYSVVGENGVTDIQKLSTMSAYKKIATKNILIPILKNHMSNGYAEVTLSYNKRERNYSFMTGRTYIAGEDNVTVSNVRFVPLGDNVQAELVIKDGGAVIETVDAYDGIVIEKEIGLDYALMYKIPYLGENVDCYVYTDSDIVAGSNTVNARKLEDVAGNYYIFSLEKAALGAKIYYYYATNTTDIDTDSVKYFKETPRYSLTFKIVKSDSTISDVVNKSSATITLDNTSETPFSYNAKYSVQGHGIAYSTQSKSKYHANLGITVESAGVFSFWYYINSEEHDRLYIRINEKSDSTNTGTEVASGLESKWTRHIVRITEDMLVNGKCTIYIAYGKWGLEPEGEDILVVADMFFGSGDATISFNTNDSNLGRDGITATNATTGATIEHKGKVSIGDEVTLAFSKVGYIFYGWRNRDTNLIESVYPTYTFVCVGNVDYDAIVGPEQAGNYVARDAKNFYTSLAAALEKNTEKRTVTVLADCTINEDLVIPSNITLIMPYSQQDETGFVIGDATNAGAKVSWNNGYTAFRTITISSNATLTINGKLIIGGVQHYPDQSAQGHTSGAFSQIVNNGGIVINIDGYLDVIGRITGSGTITANNGATLRYPFIVNNYSGGKNTKNLYESGQFPFVQFDTVNVECKQVINYGAKVIGSTSLFFSGSITTQDVKLVDKYENKTAESEGALIWLKSGSHLEISYNGKAIKEYVGNIDLSDSGLTTIDVYGSIEAGEFYLVIYGSKDKILSIPYTYNFNLRSGAVVDMLNGYKIMPGAVVTIDEGATLNVSGALHVYDGLIQADKSGKLYPSSTVLAKYGFAKSGRLINNGTLNILGTFTGIVGATANTGTITIGTDAVLSAQITDGSEGYYTNNLTVFAQTARAYALNGFITLEKGKTYKAFSQDSFVLDTFTVISAARMSNLTVELNQAMTGRFLEWNGTKFVADSMTFSLSRELVGKRVTIEGVEYVVPEDGKITINDFAFSGSKEITYFTSEYEKASVSHSRPVTLGENILDEAIVKAELDESNDYFRILNADGSVKKDFVVNVVVTYLNGETVKTEWAYGEVTALTNDNVEISHQNYSVTFKHAFYVVDKAVEQYISEVTVLKDSENISSEAVTLYAKYKELITASSETYNAFVIEYLVNYTAYAGVVVKNVKVVSAPVYGDTNAEATLVKVDGSETTDTVNVSVEDMRAEGVELKCSLVYVGEFEGKSYSVTVETNAVKRDLTVNISNKESVYGEAEVTLTASADSSTPLAYEDKIDNIGITLVKASGVNVGKYDITGTYDGYFYNVTFNDGKYEIKPFDVNIEVLDIRNLMEGYDKIVISSRTNEETPDSDFVTKLTYEIYLGEELKATVKNGTITGTLVAGAYTVKAVNTDNNYNVVSVKPAELTVVKANAYYTVEVSDGKVYDNMPITDLKSIVSVTITDTKEAVTEYAVKAKLDGKEVNELRLAGSYEIEITINETGKEQASYSRVYEISKREITVRIQDKESVYGEATEELTAYVDESTLANGENASVLGISLVKEDGKNVGTYTISGTYTNNNYDITFVNGTYTVKPKNITVTIHDKESVYGEKVQELTWKLNSDLCYDDKAESLNVTLTRSENLNVGEYDILGTWNNENYIVTFRNSNGNSDKGKYVITAKPVTVTVNDATQVYGEEETELTYVLNKEDLAYEDSKEDLNIVLSRTQGKNVGSYDITATYDNKNYAVTFNYTNGKASKYTITVREITIKVNDISNFSFNKTYEDFAKLLGFTVATDSYTIVDGDTINVTYTLMINGTVINASNYSSMICGGKHDILAEASNDNYDITVVKGSLEVTKPKVSVKDIVTEFVYDDGNAIPVFDWTKNISGKLDSANERSFKATFKRLVNGAEASEELTSITEAGTYVMTISIVHEDAYEFDENSVNTYTVTVKKKDISFDMTVVGTKESNRFAQQNGIRIYAELNTYADMESSIKSTFTVNGTETDSPYELGEYVFTAVIENDNYVGNVSYSFTIVPSVMGKTEELKQALDAYDVNASSSVRFQALTAMRNLVLSLTEDDLAQIKEDQEYTALLNRYVAAYTEYLEDMAEDVSVARKVANNSLAELIAMISGAAVAFWFGLKQSQGK